MGRDEAMGSSKAGKRRPARSAARFAVLGALLAASAAAGQLAGTGEGAAAQRPSRGSPPAVLTPLGAQAEAVSLIGEARRSWTVDLEVYELGNPEVIRALEAAERRGAVVRVVLDPTERESEQSGPRLAAAGVAVRTLWVEGGIDHVKLLVVAAPGAGGVVVFGGVNFGSTSRWTKDLDVAEGGAWVKEAEAVFDADWAAAGGEGSPAEGRYGAFALGGAAIEASLGRVLAWAQAQRRASCDVVANYLTSYWVQDALVGAAHEGVAVEAVLNPEAYGVAAARRWLAGHGVGVEEVPASPYLHAKVLVCARQGAAEAVVGSANFSYDALHHNHELDATLTGRVAEAVWRWARGVAAAARRPG